MVWRDPLSAYYCITLKPPILSKEHTASLFMVEMLSTLKRVVGKYRITVNDITSKEKVILLYS
jgi:hypothetical protein